ncbi:hypothetical protein DL770_004104 [Monosporascus sp. CRB-9-2]|nr:hypothetical protein DL770_004104 [Monosporascus sp. CRB-9-2]
MSRPKYKPQYNADDTSTPSNTDNVSYSEGYQYEDAEKDASPSTTMSTLSVTTLECTVPSTLSAASPSWTLELSTVIIFAMTVYRIAIGDVVEICVCQGAWIWCSGNRRGKEEARLEDFKLHPACIGAGIIILMNGFATFSPQMASFDEMPTVYVNTTNPNVLAAPPPPRTVTRRNTAVQGASGGWPPVPPGVSKWVIYPMAMVLLAFCYLTQTVWRTAHDQFCARKGESLPMLFCHVAKDIHAEE